MVGIIHHFYGLLAIYSEKMLLYFDNTFFFHIFAGELLKVCYI